MVDAKKKIIKVLICQLIRQPFHAVYGRFLTAPGRLSSTVNREVGSSPHGNGTVTVYGMTASNRQLRLRLGLGNKPNGMIPIRYYLYCIILYWYIWDNGGSERPVLMHNVSNPKNPRPLLLISCLLYFISHSVYCHYHGSIQFSLFLQFCYFKFELFSTV